MTSYDQIAADGQQFAARWWFTDGAASGVRILETGQRYEVHPW